MIYTDRLIEVARRKESLIAASARQRAMLAAELRAWQKPIGMIDRGIAATRFLKAHPALVAAGVVVAGVLGRRSLLRWVGRGVVVWRSWRALQTVVRRLNA
jgi:hypothetical protein